MQALVGLLLLLQGHRPADALHFLYGALTVLTVPAVYAYADQGQTRRASLFIAVACVFLVGIALRAAATGG